MSDFQKRFLFYLAAFGIWFFILYVATGGGTDLPWTSDWHRWDASWYERIWTEGYTSDPKMMVFPPGYSWIVGPVSVVTHSFDLAALLVNLSAFFTCGVLTAEFFRERFAVPAAPFFVYFLSAPVAFYTFSVYSDAVFLLIFWVALMMACRDPAKMSRAEKWRAAIFLFFVPWVRLTGYALVAWVVFRRWFALSVLLTLALWLATNAYFQGDPFHFLHMQQVFTMPAGGFFVGLKEAINSILEKSPIGIPGSDWHFWFQVAVFPLASMVLLTVTSAWFASKKEYLIALTILAVMLFSRNQAFWRSVFRYDWPLWPLIAVPLLSNNRAAAESLRARVRNTVRAAAFWVLAGTCFYIQIVFAIRMHQGYWSF